MNAGYRHLLSLAPKLHIASGSLAQCLPKAQVVSACRAMPQLDETLIFPDLLCSTYVPTRLPHGNSLHSFLEQMTKLRVLPLKKVFFHLFCGHTLHNAKGELMKDSTVLLQ